MSALPLTHFTFGKKNSFYNVTTPVFFLLLKLCTMQEIITKKEISTPALFSKKKNPSAPAYI